MSKPKDVGRASDHAVVTRLFPVLPYSRGKAGKPHPMTIAWSVAEQAYSVYVQRYGRCQTLERIAERGGWYAEELDSMLPDWRNLADDAFGMAQQNRDLAMLVMRLIRRLGENDRVAAKAKDYLDRKGMTPSILRLEAES